jgi:hypothetical protein
MVWWPVPIQRLPLGVRVMVPPVREAVRGMPSRSVKGPRGERERPVKRE